MRLHLALLTLPFGCGPERVPGGESGTGDTGTSGPDSGNDSGAPLQTRLGICDAFDVDTLNGPESLDGAPAELTDITTLGLGVVRAHRPGGGVFALSLVRGPESDVDDWTLPDTLMRAMNDAKLPLIATVYPYTDPGPWGGQVMVGYVTPEGMSDWLAFVARLVERYDGDGVEDMPGLTMPVFAWEIGNEPMCQAGDDACPAAYVDFEKPTYEAMKAAAPNSIVMIAGAAPVFRTDHSEDEAVTSIYEYFFAHDGASYTDVLSFHVPVGQGETHVGTFLDWWKATAPDTPLWIGESGTRSPQDRFVISDDPATEAAWYRTFLDDAYAGGAERVLWCRAGHAIDAVPAVYDAIHDYAASL